MKPGLIAPICFLEKYCLQAPLHLCYSSLVGNSPRYRDFYWGRSRDPVSTVILDHAPLLPRRLRGPYTNLLLALEAIRPTYVILPSSDHSSRVTIRLSKAFLSKYLGTLGKYNTKPVAMVQGYDTDDLKRCYQELKGLVPVVALPENIERLLPRNELVRSLRIKKPFFYLGVYRDLFDEFPEHSNALGAVTSMPLRLAYVGRSLSELYPTPPPLNFFLDKEPLPELAERNVKQYLNLTLE